MNKTVIILRHEFLKNVRRTGYIILTLAMPVLALLGLGVFHIVSGIAKPPAEVTKIGYVDEVGGFDQFTTRANITLVPFETPDEARRALVNGDFTDYFVIPTDFITTGVIELYTTRQQLEPPQATIATIKGFVSDNLLTGKVPEDVITRVKAPLNLVMTTLTATGEVAPQQAGYLKFIIPGAFSLLLALSLIFTSTYVLQSLSEEKENRLMEILVSSVSTRQLLVGKVLGLGAIGLVQVVIWVLSFPLLINLASSSIGSLISAIQVPAYFWVLGVIYFILGYTLFAAISASVAAVTSSVQEAQSLAGLYTLFNVAPFWFVSLLFIFPDNPVWVVLTIFPLTAPVVTMMRLGLLGVPVWQMALGVIVLALSIVGGLLLAARLLRAYMLMYGKRPNLGEIVRNFRNA